jgi:NitT/TauT family transport system substrate-binding protein
VSLALSAVLVAMVACSSSGNSASGGAGSPGEPGGSVRIAFGEISTAASHTPLYAAVAEGFFKRAGLDVTLQALTGGTPSAMAAMATGNINVMMSGSTEFIEYATKKVISGKIIGELQDSTFDVVVSKEIASIAQLKGKVLGISGLNGGDQIYLEAVLRHYGMSGKDVSFVTTGNVTNRLIALSAGAVQGIAGSNSQRALSARVGTVILKSGDSPVQIPNSLIFAASDLVTNHKSVLQKFLGALGAATTWVKANPEAAITYCIKGSGASSDDCLSSIRALADPSLAGKYTWSSTGAINTVGMESALALWATLNPGVKGLNLEDLVDNSIAGPVP